MSVPIEWLFGAGGLMLFGVLYWVREKFAHNDVEHTRIGKGVDKVGAKIDHIIMHHHPKMPEYKDAEDD